jgi:invasion protein IalB
MTRLAAALATLLVTAMSVPASAEVKAIGRYKEWRVYTEGSGSSLICFAATPAEDSAPKNVDHGDVNFYVAVWKGRTSNQTSLRVGYALRQDVAPEAIVGRERFRMYASGQEAFVEDGVERSLLAAIKKGTELRIEAAAVKDGRTAYHFSLKGSTEAIDKARALCS